MFKNPETDRKIFLAVLFLTGLAHIKWVTEAVPGIFDYDIAGTGFTVAAVLGVFTIVIGYRLYSRHVMI